MHSQQSGERNGASRRRESAQAHSYPREPPNLSHEEANGESMGLRTRRHHSLSQSSQRSGKSSSGRRGSSKDRPRFIANGVPSVSRSSKQKHNNQQCKQNQRSERHHGQRSTQYGEETRQRARQEHREQLARSSPQKRQERHEQKRQAAADSALPKVDINGHISSSLSSSHIRNQSRFKNQSNSSSRSIPSGTATTSRSSSSKLPPKLPKALSRVQFICNQVHDFLDDLDANAKSKNDNHPSSRHRQRSHSRSSLPLNPMPRPTLGLTKKVYPEKEEGTIARRESKSSSATASISKSDSSNGSSMAECKPIVVESAMRSYQDLSSYPSSPIIPDGGVNTQRRGKSIGRSGRRRRGSLSLSRQVKQALHAYHDNPSFSRSYDFIHDINCSVDQLRRQKNELRQLELLMQRDDNDDEDSRKQTTRAQYGVQFDPVTGMCPRHPGVCMARRTTKDDYHAKRPGGLNANDDRSAIGSEWNIIRATCPRCMYNC
mmetsp:Transcript_43660/g.91858  ORF Transcript_43660/g.91858 Transcript_43660/m.91858 type:complete len:489 (-) Transcript_43660:60-1526(-)